MHRYVMAAVLASIVAGCTDDKRPAGSQGKSAGARGVSLESLGTAHRESPSLTSQTPPAATDVTASPEVQPADLPQALIELFEQLDELGRAPVKDAEFVSLILVRDDSPDRQLTEACWKLAESETKIIVLKDDLIPWVYDKRAETTIPSSWHPYAVRLKSVTAADFDAVCLSMVEPKKQPADESERIMPLLDAPGPSHRLLVAHAAWKRSRSDVCRQIMELDPKLLEDMKATGQAVLDDLAWLHFLRGVNLLMFADPRDVIPHLRLAARLSPGAKFGTDIDDLTTRLEKLIAEREQPGTAQIPEAALTDSQKADRYVAQLKDLHCRQWGQPGWINPFVAFAGEQADENPPSQRLLDLEMGAIPALIKALLDDTPTRTVYHWRDFHHSRVVWRVSDFAWTILRGITDREFGNRRIVGFTMSSMEPDERQAVIREIEEWYAENKDRSPDDRKYSAFASHDPDDWLTAGRYFLEKQDKRAVTPLLKLIPGARDFSKGQLCELVARFGDQTARPVLADVLKRDTEPADRMSAAIALWAMGDSSGVPVAIDYLKEADQPYGGWETPAWFLVQSHTNDGLEALRSVVIEGPARRASEVMFFIEKAVTGDGPGAGASREPVPSAEICPLLVAAMDRDVPTDGSINGVEIRIKDSAAQSLARLRQGLDDPSVGFSSVDPELFNQLEPDVKKRDEQIAALKGWYQENKDRLVWDAKQRKLVVKPAQ